MIAFSSVVSTQVPQKVFLLLAVEMKVIWAAQREGGGNKKPKEPSTCIKAFGHVLSISPKPTAAYTVLLSPSHLSPKASIL